jgi:hypothetical protein
VLPRNVPQFVYQHDLKLSHCIDTATSNDYRLWTKEKHYPEALGNKNSKWILEWACYLKRRSPYSKQILHWKMPLNFTLSFKNSTIIITSPLLC